MGHLKGKPSINYLEIGVFEGRSAIWMLENILTASTAKMTCMDIFPGQLQGKFLANLRISGFYENVTVIKGRSQVELRYLPLNSFDIVYIDWFTPKRGAWRSLSWFRRSSFDGGDQCSRLPTYKALPVS